MISISYYINYIAGGKENEHNYLYIKGNQRKNKGIWEQRRYLYRDIGKAI